MKRKNKKLNLTKTTFLIKEMQLKLLEVIIQPISPIKVKKEEKHDGFYKILKMNFATGGIKFKRGMITLTNKRIIFSLKR